MIDLTFEFGLAYSLLVELYACSIMGSGSFLIILSIAVVPVLLFLMEDLSRAAPPFTTTDLTPNLVPEPGSELPKLLFEAILFLRSANL